MCPRVIAASVLLGLSLAASPAFAAEPAAAKSYKVEFAAEARSAALCESVPNRVFVDTGANSECVAYFNTPNPAGKRTAVFFLDGDINLKKYGDSAGLKASLSNAQKYLESWSKKLKVQYVFLSRLGVNGSSGNYGDRRRPHETHVMGGAIDILKARLGIDDVVLAGQSGGSTISASLLALGRQDISCAILGSGAFELADLEYKLALSRGRKVRRAEFERAMFDPSHHVAAIAVAPLRRIFVIGDEGDTKTPFDQQQRFQQAVSAAGHHAVLVAIEAKGEFQHDVAGSTVPAAGACLNGLSDVKLIKALHNAGKPAAQTAGLQPVARHP